MYLEPFGSKQQRITPNLFKSAVTEKQKKNNRRLPFVDLCWFQLDRRCNGKKQVTAIRKQTTNKTMYNTWNTKKPQKYYDTAHAAHDDVY